MASSQPSGVWQAPHPCPAWQSTQEARPCADLRCDTYCGPMTWHEEQNEGRAKSAAPWRTPANSTPAAPRPAATSTGRRSQPL
jgi:hypothetical protein